MMRYFSSDDGFCFQSIVIRIDSIVRIVSCYTLSLDLLFHYYIKMNESFLYKMFFPKVVQSKNF